MNNATTTTIWTPDTVYLDPAGKVFPPSDLDNPELFTPAYLEHMTAWNAWRDNQRAEQLAGRHAGNFRRTWDNVPSRWRNCSLETLAPSPLSYSPIAEQAERIAVVKANPTGNYLFCGAGCAGKTHLLYTLYRHRLEEWSRHPLAHLPTVHLLNTHTWLAGVSGHAQDPSKPAPHGDSRRDQAGSRQGTADGHFF